MRILEEKSIKNKRDFLAQFVNHMENGAHSNNNFPL